VVIGHLKQEMVAWKVKTIRWLCEEQTKSHAVFLGFKMASYMAAKISIFLCYSKTNLDSTRTELA
jgi:hypothetical protein